jgi:hypothetical protein
MIDVVHFTWGLMIGLLAVFEFAARLRSARKETADFRERCEHWRRKDIEKLQLYGEAMDRALVAEDALGEVLRRYGGMDSIPEHTVRWELDQARLRLLARKVISAIRERKGCGDD